MNQQILDIIIKENRLDDLKHILKTYPLNAHHKNLVLEKCFLYSDTSMIEYMLTKASASAVDITTYLIKSLDSQIPKSKLYLFKNVSDQLLLSKIEKSHIEKIVVHQDGNFASWFIEKFPIVSAKYFKTFAYTAVKVNKDEYLKPFEGFTFDTSSCFNVCICAFENNAKDLMNTFLKAQIKLNPDIISILKFQQNELYDKYLEEKRLYNMRYAAYQASLAARNLLPKSTNNTSTKTPAFSKQELMNDFLMTEIPRAFKEYLEEKFTQKTEEKQKKSKI